MQKALNSIQYKTFSLKRLYYDWKDKRIVQKIPDI